VYSYGRTLKKSRSVMSENWQRNLRQRQPIAIALLRSFRVKKGPLSYKHLAPFLPRSREATNLVRLRFQLNSPKRKARGLLNKNLPSVPKSS
jgi:hypothetical protein